MSETPYNKPKVSLKLHELEYKLDVEKTVLKGIKGMVDVLERTPSTDRKSRLDVQDKMLESTEKLGLLNSALRKYKSLYIGEGGDEDDYGKVYLEKKKREGVSDVDQVYATFHCRIGNTSFCAFTSWFP